jgi:hypothetical protein
MLAPAAARFFVFVARLMLALVGDALSQVVHRFFLVLVSHGARSPLGVGGKGGAMCMPEPNWPLSVGRKLLTNDFFTCIIYCETNHNYCFYRR